MRSQAIGALLIHGPALALVLITLALVGQPIYANDTWIHLALGEAFASQGPLLAADHICSQRQARLPRVRGSVR